jgi:hypothetical protein
LGAIQDQNGLETNVAVAGDRSAGLIFQKGNAWAITHERLHPMDGDTVSEGAEQQMLPTAVEHPFACSLRHG